VRKFRYAPKDHCWPGQHTLLGTIEPGGVYEADDYAATGLIDSPDWVEVPGDEPVPGYCDLNVDEVLALLEQATPDEVEAIKAYEAANKDRKTIREFAPDTGAHPDGTNPAGDAGEEE
jgi:hypothetical protein